MKLSHRTGCCGMINIRFPHMPDVAGVIFYILEYAIKVGLRHVPGTDYQFAQQNHPELLEDRQSFGTL